MADKLNLQDNFLNVLKKGKIPVTVHVINGYQLNHLLITGYDSFVILAKNSERDMMIYKHAISTITPETDASKKETDNE